MSNLKSKIKDNPKIKKFILWAISPSNNPKPRLWVRWFINPFVHNRGKGAVIRRWRSRIDVFPWKRFDVGEYSTIEDFTTINNGAGDVIIGKRARVGIGSVVIGPVTMGDGSGLGQNVFVSGFNHGYKDGTQNSSKQALDVRPTIIGAESHIGANCVVLPGVKIGKRCQVGAGSVVTKDIPDLSIAVGNPAKIIKRFDEDNQKWINV